MKKPNILIPYEGPDSSGDTTDIFIYLRPESNGVNTESSIMKVIYNFPEHEKSIKMVYFANYPGSFIKSKHLIEHHYSHKLKAAEEGRKAFTEKMRECFEKHFKTDFFDAEILGAYDALKKFSMSEEELFNLWVNKKDLCSVYGHTIKKYKDTYIINYDIPALLHRKHLHDDIAVMVFRTSIKWNDLKIIVKKMRDELHKKGLIDRRHPPERVFHFTRGPFEQILDGLEYLYNSEKKDPMNISFFKFLRERSFSRNKIYSLIKNPVIRFKDGNTEKEDSIYEATKGMTYPEAVEFAGRIIY